MHANVVYESRYSIWCFRQYEYKQHCILIHVMGIGFERVKGNTFLNFGMWQIINVNILCFRQYDYRQYMHQYTLLLCLKPHMFTSIISHILIDLSYPTTPLKTYFYPLTLSKPIPITCINIQCCLYSYYLKRHMPYLLSYTTFACMSIPKCFLRASVRS